MQRKLIDLRTVFAMILLAATAHSVAPAQKRPPQSKPAAAKKCSGAWTGSVRYSRTMVSNEAKTTPRVSTMGEDSTVSEMRQEYKARALVMESPERDGSSTARASITAKLTSEEKTSSKERISCDRGKTWQVASGDFSRNVLVEGSNASVEANVTVGFNDDGTYNVAAAFPQIEGESSGTFKSKFSGQCVAKKGVDERSYPERASISGNSLISDGSHRLDPKNPDRLSGSYTRTGPGGVEETLSWSLRRCGAALMITEVELYQPVFPSYNNWTKLSNYTIDGNFVKVVAKIANVGGQPQSTPIEFRETSENVLLPEGKNVISLDPYEEREIVYMWDTSGYAWKDSDAGPVAEMRRRVDVRITGDARGADVEVHPKPVVVVPGLFSAPESVATFVDAIKRTPSTNWAVDYARIVRTKSAAENSAEVAARIAEMQERTNAWHVDLVAHSTGGLAARVYINDDMGQLADGRPLVTNLVMVGTPNKGTPCSIGVDTIFSRFFNRSGDAYREITYRNMQEFNRRYKVRKGTRFHALVGSSSAQTCQLRTPGDGLVPAGSALWQVADYKFAAGRQVHEFMMSETANIDDIRKWLAIGPKGDHNPVFDAPAAQGSVRPDAETLVPLRGYGAMFRPLAAAADDENYDAEPVFVTGARLAPRQSTEIEIPLAAGGGRIAVNAVAPEKVAIELVRPDGTVAAASAAATPDARRSFRTIGDERPFGAGTWKLRLRSESDEPAEVAAAAFVFP